MALGTPGSPCELHSLACWDMKPRPWQALPSETVQDTGAGWKGTGEGTPRDLWLGTTPRLFISFRFRPGTADG